LCLESVLSRTRAPYELILVDNGSTDDTPGVLASLLPSYPFARSVRVDVNQGYGHGLATGLRAARGQVLAWSHADLQTDPGDVFRALRVYRAAACPERTLVKGHRHGRRASERFISWSMQTISTVLFCTRMREINAQPKLFHRGLLVHLADPPLDFNFDVYVLYQALRHGWRVQSLPVQFPPRPYGQSNWAATWRSKVRTITRSVRYMCRLAAAGN
jgi:glycosyltransferase involved in cell wall biosynthesis